MPRHPRIAISSPHMSTYRFAEMLPRVAEHFAVWEVFGEGQQYLWDIEDTFRALTPSYDLRFTAHAPISDINISSFNPDVRELALRIVRRSIDSCARLGIPRITIHPGLRMPMARWDEERLRALTIEAAHDLARHGADLGVEVCLENMPTNWVMTFQDPDWFEGVFSEEAPLRFCYDAAHAHTVPGDALERYAKGFARWTRNVHVSDNEGRQDAHWVLGKGTLPLEEQVRVLEREGYGGNYVIESNDFEEGVESVPVLERALAAAGS